MNPTTGTFTSMDAYQGSTSDPMSLHKYLFANANPVMYSDPSGYDTYTVEETSTAVTMMTALANVANGFSQTAIAVFNSLTATLFTAVVTVGAPIAMFVGNNPQFIDICLRIANGEIRLDALRDYLLDLYNDLGDKVTDLVDRVSDTTRNAGNSSSNSSGNSQPPDPNDLERILQFFKDGETVEFSFTTSKGIQIQGLADVNINGTTLTLRNFTVYSTQGDIPNIVGPRNILAFQNQIVQLAKDQGFTQVIIQGERVAGSSSALPGKVVDYVLNIT